MNDIMLFLKWLFQNNFWVVAITLLCEKWHITFRKLPQSDVRIKTNLVIEWFRLPRNIVISQYLADQLFASAYGFTN